MKCKCLKCGENIDGRDRIIINRNHLGSLTVVGNLHIDCWDEIIKVKQGA